MKQGWLDDLIALLDAGSVVGAATARHISQSAFSRRIQVIEHALGIELIDRSSKPHVPRDVLQAHSEEIRELAFKQRHLLKQMQIEGRTGTKLLVIACQHAIATSLGPLIVKAVSSEGERHVRLRSANLDECQALLLTEQADIALTYQPRIEDAKMRADFLEEVVVGEDTLVPVFASHAINGLMWNYHNGDLDIIAYPSDVFLGRELNRKILPDLERSCRLNVLAETALSPAALQLAASAIGLAWVPRALASGQLGDGTLVDLGDQFGRVEMDVVAQRLTNRSDPASTPVWLNLRQYLQEQ